MAKDFRKLPLEVRRAEQLLTTTVEPGTVRAARGLLHQAIMADFRARKGRAFLCPWEYIALSLKYIACRWSTSLAHLQTNNSASLNCFRLNP